MTKRELGHEALLMIRVNMFMDFLGYGNHVELYSEEISSGGEGLGVCLPRLYIRNDTDGDRRTHRKRSRMLH